MYTHDPVQLELFPSDTLTPDTIPAFVACLNDKLAPHGLHVRVNRSAIYPDLGQYYLVDCVTSEIREVDCDVKALGVELGLWDEA